MIEFLGKFVFLLAFVVLLGYFNEKVTKLTHEISLMLFSFLAGSVFLVIGTTLGNISSVQVFLEQVQVFDLEMFLVKGVLCFMLFAGSCHMHLADLKKYAKGVTVLAVGATFLGAVFYGLLFYGASYVLGMHMPLPVCLMFGSVVAPTDPIAATSILKKFNLPSGIGFTIEGESLFNDGVGVALFVCFSGLVTAQENGGVLFVLFKELFGAILVGCVVTVICFLIFSRTRDEARQIFTSLLAVSMSYLLCDVLGFSGAIASVVCGILFSAFRDWQEQKGMPMELQQFDSFWEILDNLLNSVLYVILGLSFLHILQMPDVFLLSLVAIAANLLARSGSLGISVLFLRELPDGYDRGSFIKLLTWGGLRGGLSVALAMSTRPMLDENTYYIVLGCTYAIVFFTTIVQGLTMKRVYQGIERKRVNKCK